jgi:hypothetical protein
MQVPLVAFAGSQAQMELAEMVPTMLGVQQKQVMEHQMLLVKVVPMPLFPQLL